MARRAPSRGNSPRKTRRGAPRRKAKRARIPKLWPAGSTRKKLYRSFRRAPLLAQLAIGLVALGFGGLLLNGLYQVVRKPSELFFPVSGTLYKTPTETWDSYAPIFERHSTATITPEFLAALAQIEGSGNPIVRTYWRLTLSSRPFEIYRPASSAVGMYQITNGTFAEARRLCIHDHAVVDDGPWNEPKSCWFNSLYTRTVPSHAVELTSAYLDRHVSQALSRRGARRANAQQRHALAAVIHLCGAGAGRRYAARGLRLLPGQRCGDHEVAKYVAKVKQMQAVFARLHRQT